MNIKKQINKNGFKMADLDANYSAIYRNAKFILESNGQNNNY